MPSCCYIRPIFCFAIVAVGRNGFSIYYRHARDIARLCECSSLRGASSPAGPMMVEERSEDRHKEHS